MADVDLRPWVQSGSTLDDVEAAVAEVSVRSPYVYIDAWDLEADTLRPRYRYDSFEISTEQIRAALGVAQASDEIRATGVTKASDVAIAVHDWLAESATYDAELAAAYSDGSIAADDDAVDAASAFRPFGTVGLGYARAFASIAHELGIDAEVVTGQLDGMRHAWNTVVIDGAVLAVDVATDDAKGGEASSERLSMSDERARELGYRPDAVPRP
ncbi:transglutaminase domain-containing protein [Demequina lignilytica]|uniref:Transglutaminase domain-containing protein n=1 Tax=Demequina lignilytica TaxID=3051663 RepID=A0AB35MHI4_9MICO|nr:transglutaminase domain-containing protein [Demequina sp. SYSU T0a273]MDN4483197.1 transglutaminase domain-containing protein [Demequina sp. SYSU T0a273]